MDAVTKGTEPDPLIDFVSLGMVILDEIHIPNQSPMLDVVGGSGTFSTLGYRLLTPVKEICKVGCLVLAGGDFPDAVHEQLNSWDVTLFVKTYSNKLSSRGLLEYEDDTLGPKKFAYTTPPLKSTPTDLIGTPFLVAKAFHFFATPQEIQLQIPELLTLRGTAQRPFVVWEPFPRACTAANRSAFVEACRYVDVFSPNQIELAALFEDTQSHVFDKEKVEGHARHFTHSTKIGIILVRCGQHGSLTLTSSGEPLWLPPFYSSGAKEVVDPTGAGNTFLGGFMAGWERTKDVREASMYGNVAASFAVEQVGLPTLTRDEGDVWNGVRAVDRLAQYRSRIGLNL